MILNRQRTIQLYIESTNGVQLNDCVKANKIVKNVLKSNQIYKDYTLEVSSPGIYRKLITPYY